MRKPACGYCWRPSIATILVSTWFGWRKQWRPVCINHVKRSARPRG